MRVSTQVGGPEWFVGVVYFYLKSNLSSLINGSDEGSDSVPGDGESKTDRETENEQTRRFIWTWAGARKLLLLCSAGSSCALQCQPQAILVTFQS